MEDKNTYENLSKEELIKEIESLKYLNRFLSDRANRLEEFLSAIGIAYETYKREKL